MSLMKKIFKHLKENWIRHGFETLVVIVGVLIAFSLSNWHNKNRERKVELEIISSIRNALILDTLELNRKVQRINRILEFAQNFSDAANGKSYEHDQLLERLQILSVQMGFEPVTSPYKYLESKGFATIRDENLRSAIIELYDKYYDKINTRDINFNNNLRDFRRPLVRKHFTIIAHDGLGLTFKPLAFDQMLQDKDLLSEVSIMYSNSRNITIKN